MGELVSRWLTNVGAVAVAVAGLLSVGCGGYYEDAEYPRPYVAEEPPSAAELAAQREARQRATVENREIVVGADDEDVEYVDTDPSALTEFRTTLDGHGAWVDDSVYGTVWVPSAAEVGSDFQPYVTAGHWTYSDATDYVWVSDYSWGWAPFHYGRWTLLPGHGWSWIPGRRYAGAWVTWRVGPSGYGYVGWAPLAPTWYWSRGTAVGWTFGHHHASDHYVYCPSDRMYQGAVGTHVVRGPSAREHDGRTHDYIAASPGVGGFPRTVARPSVNGRDDRVVAAPRVGGARTPATPSVARGPRPADFGVRSEAVIAPPASDPALARSVRSPARPSLVAQPSRGPSYADPSPPYRPSQPTTVRATPSVRPWGAERSAMSPGLGGSRPPPIRSSPSVSTRPFDASPRIAASPVHSSPVYRATPSRSPPSFRASPSVSAPGHAIRSAPTPSFRASPSVRSAVPAVTSPNRSYASPSVRGAVRR